MEVTPEGYLMLGFRRADGTWTPVGGAVPDAFWARLKHEVMRQGLVDEFKAAEAEAGANENKHNDAERALFSTWFRRLGFPRTPGAYDAPQLWPWARGWTEDKADAYLTNVLREVA